MPENAIDDSRIRDERDYLHLGATAAQEEVHLENPLDKAGPRCPGAVERTQVVSPDAAGSGAGGVCCSQKAFGDCARLASAP